MLKKFLRSAESDSDESANLNRPNVSSKSTADSGTPLRPRSRKQRFLEGSSSSEDDNPAPVQQERSSKTRITAGSALTSPLSKAIEAQNDHRADLEDDLGVSIDAVPSASSSSQTKRRTATTAPSTHFGSPNNFWDDEYRPAFQQDFNRADEALDLGHMVHHGVSVPLSLNRHVARYLLDHQAEGVRWLVRKYLDRTGSILGDDMGMGKTVQVAAFLSVLFHKTGAREDKELAKQKRKGDAAIDEFASIVEKNRRNVYFAAKPVLLLCPKTLVDNWKNELTTWGYFLLDELTAGAADETVHDLVERAQHQQAEIVLLSYSLLDRFIDDLCTVKWQALILDEGHLLKNDAGKTYKDIQRLKHTYFRLMLTGTPVQNDLRELWSLLNLLDQDGFIPKADFKRDIEKPIKHGMSLTASKAVLTKAQRANEELGSILTNCLLARKKETLSGKYALKGKEEIIVFCDLSPLQRRMYEECLASPDFDNVRYHAQPCPCGSLKPRGRCCSLYRIPLARDPAVRRQAAGGIDPRAALWRQFHVTLQPCGSSSSAAGTMAAAATAAAEQTPATTTSTTDHKKVGCPLCMLLPCLIKLGKIACHPVLLQVDARHGDVQKQQQTLDFLRHVFTPETVQQLGGYERSSSFLKLKSAEESGKMQTLRSMLRLFMEKQEKTLIFSYSTQVLDLLEAMVIAEGWRCLRLDGQTPAKRRQQMVDQFNQAGNPSAHSHSSGSSARASDPTLIFLISSRAGGVGLNLYTATKVIIFDVNWNPVIDMQSQDRAYRIGQKDQVSVYRLVAKGTVEELAYMRQLYKQQLQKTVLGSHYEEQPEFRRGQFAAVEGEASMRGELFGVENLFQFTTESILQTLYSRFHHHQPLSSTVHMEKASSAATQNLMMNQADAEAVLQQVTKEAATEQQRRRAQHRLERARQRKRRHAESNHSQSRGDSLLLTQDDEDEDAEWSQPTQPPPSSAEIETVLPAQKQPDSTVSTTTPDVEPPVGGALEVLAQIGIDLRNAHRNEDLLNVADDHQTSEEEEEKEEEEQEADNKRRKRLSLQVKSKSKSPLADPVPHESALSRLHRRRSLDVQRRRSLHEQGIEGTLLQFLDSEKGEDKPRTKKKQDPTQPSSASTSSSSALSSSHNSQTVQPDAAVQSSSRNTDDHRSTRARAEPKVTPPESTEVIDVEEEVEPPKKAARRENQQPQPRPVPAPKRSVPATQSTAKTTQNNANKSKEAPGKQFKLYIPQYS